MIKAGANGQDPYIWVKEYVDELNRKEYDEQKEILIKCSPSKDKKQNCHIDSKKEFLWGRGSALFSRMILVIYTQ